MLALAAALAERAKDPRSMTVIIIIMFVLLMFLLIIPLLLLLLLLILIAIMVRLLLLWCLLLSDEPPYSSDCFPLAPMSIASLSLDIDGVPNQMNLRTCLAHCHRRGSPLHDTFRGLLIHRRRAH